METFLEALEGTPWYVFLIFIYVVYIGISSLRTRTVKYQVIFVLPTLLTLWSLSLLYTRWRGDLPTLLIWGISLFVGIGMGWKILSFYKYRIDRSRGTITLPGNKWTLVLVLILFVARYTYGYLYATMDEIPKFFITSDFALSGILIGIFIGRALHYFYSYSKMR